MSHDSIEQEWKEIFQTEEFTIMPYKTLSIFIFVVFYKYVSCYLRVCYYTNWSQYRPGLAQFTPDKVDPNLCTHIIFAFAKLERNKLAPFEFNDETKGTVVGMYEQINNMKRRNPNLKTLLAVGGWNAGSAPFSEMVSTAASRQEFINSTLVYLRERNFNGLDLDWEYPAKRGGVPADKPNLVLFLSELRRAFEQESYHTGKERLLLTCAVPAGKDNIDAGFDVPNIARNLDFINIMTYDLHGSWEPTTGHNSPLYSRAGEAPESAMLNMDWAAKYWIRHGAPKHKLIIGFGLYGRSFKLRSPLDNGMGSPAIGAGKAGNFTKEAGFMAYFEVCEEMKNGATRVWHAEHKCPYLYKDDLWVGYDDDQSISEKIKWLKAGGYGGVMVWSLALDDFSGKFCNQGRYPLLRIINREMKNTAKVVQSAAPELTPVIPNGIDLTGSLSQPIDPSLNDIMGLVAGHASTSQHTQPAAAMSLPSAMDVFPASNTIIPAQPQSPPISNIDIIQQPLPAGQIISENPVLLNVPPSVAQVVSAPAAQNIQPSVAISPAQPPFIQDVPASQLGQISNIGINNIPVASNQFPVVLNEPPTGSIVQPSIVQSGNLPSASLIEIAPIDNTNIGINSAPPGQGQLVISQPNGIDTLDLNALPASSFGGRRPTRPRRPLNFSFSSSSSSSSNSSSSSSNSSSSSSVNMNPGLTITEAIQQALNGNPNDAVIIADLPPDSNTISNAIPRESNVMSVINPTESEPPTLQLSQGDVIPITSVSSLEELLASLNTNIPTANAILLPETNNQITQSALMNELSAGNVLQSGIARALPSNQPQRGRSSSGSIIRRRIPTSRLSRRQQSLSRPTIAQVASSPRRRATGIQDRRALAAALRTNPALRARFLAARRRTPSNVRRRFRTPATIPTTSEALRSQPTSRSRSRVSLPRARQILPSSSIQQQRRRLALAGQRIPDSVSTQRQLLRRTNLRNLSPAQLRLLRARLRSRTSASPSGQSLSRVTRMQTVRPSRTGSPTRTSLSRLRRPTSSSRSTFNPFRGLQL